LITFSKWGYLVGRWVKEGIEVIGEVGGERLGIS